MKKLLTSLLCVMMVVCFMPAMAWADGEESVSSLPEAVDGVITLDSGKVYEVGASALTPGDTTPVIEVDLQGSTLIVDGTIEFSGSNKVLTIKDSSASKGTLKFTEKTDPSNADIITGAGGIVNAENINIITPNTAFLPKGDAAQVNITNCNVQGGTYCVGTNAGSTDNYNVAITLKNSTLTAVGREGAYQADNCAVIINVKGTLDIDNCTITGDRQGVIVRAGTATITNSTIESTGKYNGTVRDADNWTSGNEVNVGALIVGNNPSSTAYNAEANVTIENSEFIGSETTPAIYVNVNNRTDYGTELTIGGENTKVGTFAKNTSAQAEASITILGGTFSDPDAIGSYVVEGMKVDENGKVVIDTDEAVAEVNGVGYTTLPAAVEAANANDTITLLKDVELESELVLRKAIVLDGANHKITYKGSNTADHLLELLASATVKNVTLDSDKTAKGVNTYASDKTLKITFENVTMVNSAGNGLTAKGGEVTLKKVSISGSTWTQSVDISSSSSELQNGATLKIDDQCTFGDAIAIVIDKPSENEVAAAEPLDANKLKITSSDETKQWNADEEAYTKRIFTITKVTSTPSTGGYVPTTPTVQKPVIEPNADVTTTLSTDGTTLTIKANDGYEITDVTVNGVSKGAVTTLTGLKTGDKVVVTAKKIETPDDNAALIEAVKSVKLVARSAMSKAQGKKAVKITWYATDGSDVELDGVEIFRSTKRYSGYGTTPIFTTAKAQYHNTAIKKGTKYYYKVRGYKIIDGEKVYTDWSTKAWRTVK